MDIVESCEAIIEKKLDEIRKHLGNLRTEDWDERCLQSQALSESPSLEMDKNLDRIMDQQANFKLLIEKDGRIDLLKKRIKEDKKFISEIRKACSKIGLDSLKNRQELLDTQAKERERFQMQQLRSIAEDYRRHQNILDLRKKEILTMKKEVENEETKRGAYLADVERNLEKQLQNRQRQRQTGECLSSVFGHQSVTDELNNPNHIELTSVDEYAPYGTAPHSRINQGSKRGGSSGRGRRRKQTAVVTEE